MIFLSMLFGLVLPSRVACVYTYWIDSSCGRFANQLNPALDDALTWAGTASARLAFENPPEDEYFGLLFSSPDDPRYDEFVNTVNRKHKRMSVV